MENNSSGDRPLTRRHALQVGGLGLLGITLPRLLESQRNAQRAESVQKQTPA